MLVLIMLNLFLISYKYILIHYKFIIFQVFKILNKNKILTSEKN